jgi:hypothetical protein
MSSGTTKSEVVVNEKIETSLKDLLFILKNWLRFLLKKAWIILIITIIGIFAGYLMGRFTKPHYLATCTFVLQEENNASAGGLSLLGLGGGEKKAGLFEGDNLKWLYSTRLMLQKTLFTVVKKDNKDILLLNWFLEMDPTAKKTIQSNLKYKDIKFDVSDPDSTMNEDKNNIIALCVGIINAKYLKVADMAKTDGVIEVDITSSDEKFAKTFNEVLVNNVNEYYVQNKTSKVAKQVRELQQQVDDYNSKMNTSLYSTAQAVEAIPYPNPNNQVNQIAPKRKGIDAELNTAIYIQLMKSLENSKMELQKATPLIQMVDAPVLPLQTTNKPAIFYMIVFGLVGFAGSVVLLIFRKALKDTMAP